MSFTDQIADIEISNGTVVFEATGFLVGPNHLVTNTHVLFDDFGVSLLSQGFTLTARFSDGEVAGRQAGSAVTSFDAPGFFDGDNLIANDTTQFDYAFVHLDSNVGARNGFFRVASGETNQPSSLTIAGFPAVTSDGDTLRSDKVTPVYNDDGNFLSYTSDVVEPGASGSPLFFKNDAGKDTVIGIQSTGAGSTGNAGMLGGVVLDSLRDFIATQVATGDDDELSGSSGADRIEALGGDDQVTGKQGNDRLSGQDGNDDLIGGGGRDRIFGGRDDDLLRGGDGADEAYGGQGSDRLSGQADNDRLSGGNGADLLSGGQGDDRLAGGGGNDRLIGGRGHDHLSGAQGKDRLDGERGNDRLVGAAGDDRLAGAGGKDRIEAGNGRDRVDGGSGNDTLTGGKGADTFHFDRGDDRDRLTDFQQGLDMISFGKGVSGFGQIDIAQAGAHTAITYSGGRILVLREDADDFTVDDFIF